VLRWVKADTSEPPCGVVANLSKVSPRDTSLFSRATTVRLKTDEVLFLVGDTGDGCYRVKDGLLKVMMVSHAGSERILAFLGPGAIVGEMSIIDQLPRSASVVAVRPPS
jgi:CRP/FNR family cyclic AMP-dependent transcriptional regulator